MSRPPASSEMTERWNRVQNIVADASLLQATDRVPFIDRACGGALALREEVESLLRSTEGADDYLESLAGRVGIPFHADDDAPPPELTRIGSYRLVRRIGEGGMGTVYLGERDDGEFDMRVAVKLLPPAIRTEATTRRFAAERRILARLAHPGIARILDAGVADGGVPFLIMEYVAGLRLDTFCDEHRLDINERLDLFLEVCDIVAYAHERSVVHRDLKPGNILVSADRKLTLLDFGVARVLDGAWAEESTLTARAGLPMTLSYASPEQLNGGKVEFSSDVYQLGVILHLLLTGRLPFDPIEAGSFAELARVASTRRVVPASRAVGLPGQARAGLPGPDPSLRAAIRRTNVRALRARLAGGIDAILYKALHPEPHRRYATVASLARELREHRAGRPIAVTEEPGPSRGSSRVEAMPEAGGSAPVHKQAEAPRPARSRVAVFPFSVPPGEAFDYLREGLVSVLTAALDESGVLDPVDAGVILRTWSAADLRNEKRPDPAEVAERLDADLYIVGEVLASEGGVRLEASLYRVTHPDEPWIRASAQGGTDGAYDLVDEVAIRLLAGSARPHAVQFAHAAAAATTSLPAFKHFLAGENALDKGNFFAAAHAFQLALEADADFGVAYHRLAVSAVWAHNLGLARHFATEASARSRHLPVPQQRLLVALEQYLAGHTADAEAGYAVLLANAPADVEAAFMVGTLRFFHNALRGRPQADARPDFERVLATRPNHILALLYLSTIVARAGDFLTLELLTQRIVELHDGEETPAYPVVARVQRAFVGRSRRERDRAIDELRAAGSLAAITAAHIVVTPDSDLEGARRVADLLIDDPDATPDVRATGHTLRAHVEWGHGRIRAAREHLAQGEALGSIEAREYGALMTLSPVQPSAKGALEALRADFLSRDGADSPGPPPPIPHFAPHHGIHASIRSWLRGIAEARLGNFEDAIEAARDLEAAGAKSSDVTLVSFAHGVRAEVLLHRDGPAAALALLEAHELATSLERTLSSSFHAQIHARYARAELLRAVGRTDDAFSWYATFGHHTFFDAAYLAPARLRQAEILAARGERERAAGCYRRFLDLWAECDEELRPMTEAARAELATLTASGSPS